MKDSTRKIAVDVMGCDDGPREAVEGALAALNHVPDDILLVGPEKLIEPLLGQKHASSEQRARIQIVPADDVVTMHDSPTEALRKRNSSLFIAVEQVRNGEAFGLVSPGNTGATMATTKLRWRALPGVSRPAIATIIPAVDHPCVLIDVGANVDCKPRHLLHFAIMGAVYAQEILRAKTPRVGLLSVGEEESKGNALTAATYEMLQASGLNFVGNAEGRDILNGKFDVIVCDGFIGNIVLKFGESLASHLMTNLRKELKFSVIASLAALAMKPTLKRFARKVDPDEYGGAPLLGVNGVCIISHGSSNRKAIMNAIRTTSQFSVNRVNQRIVEDIAQYSPPQATAEVI